MVRWPTSRRRLHPSKLISAKSSASTNTSITRTGLLSSMKSSRHSGNSVHCPRSAPQRSASSASPAESRENHSKHSVFTQPGSNGDLTGQPDRVRFSPRRPAAITVPTVIRRLLPQIWPRHLASRSDQSSRRPCLERRYRCSPSDRALRCTDVSPTTRQFAIWARHQVRRTSCRRRSTRSIRTRSRALHSANTGIASAEPRCIRAVSIFLQCRQLQRRDVIFFPAKGWSPRTLRDQILGSQDPERRRQCSNPPANSRERFNGTLISRAKVRRRLKS